MATLSRRLNWATKRLQELLDSYRIPGASMSIWFDGEEFNTATGFANLRAKIEATTDSLFLIGSNTKLYTTSLVMQLVEQGEVDLDSPVKRYVPELRLNDLAATEAVTVRHLLTHTSGITGDYFPDFGRGEDAVQRCVESLADVPMLHEPGSMFSYCNSGFILAGRLIERVTGESWDRALADRLLEPIGTTAFATLPEEALRYRVAIGHAADSDTGQLRPASMWPEVRSGGPAGFTPFATASELVRFARLHLEGGRSTDGHQVLSRDSVSAMQSKEVLSVPSGALDSDGWGLGWAQYRYDDNERVIGHNGGSAALLRVLPDRNFAVASLTNASGGMYVGHHIINDVVNELFGVSIPVRKNVSGSTANLHEYEGMYHHHTRTREVRLEGGRLTALASRDAPPITLEPVGSNTFVAWTDGVDIPAMASFVGPSQNGTPWYLHIGGRAHRRE